MLVKGHWDEVYPGLKRPMLIAQLLDADYRWHDVAFLLDSGADESLLSYGVIQALGHSERFSDDVATGIGGFAPAIHIPTRLRFTATDREQFTIEHDFKAIAEKGSIELNLLGRDLTQFFSVIIDEPNEIVVMLRPPHRYHIEVEEEAS